jgi:AcrR family transcriptional regulator
MTVETSLRERKKEKTRRLLSEIALRRFSEKGVDATTVEEICEEAEVSVSTFFRYFPSKEAAAFPDEDARVEVVSEVLLTAPAGEPVITTVRRAALALVDYDLEAKVELHKWLELLEDEPALTAHRLRVQQETMDLFTQLVARRMGVDPRTDMRPRLVVGAAYAAAETAWAAWMEGDGKGDLKQFTNDAFDVIDSGLRKSLK